MALAGRFMLGLLVFKLLATLFTLGAGNSGGVFAPGLFMDAMLGGLIGRIGNEIDPTIFADPGAYALVGMAALFAGAACSPITAIIIVLEMSNDYKIILPLLMAVMVSTLVSDFLHPDSIYTKKLSLRGIHLNVEEDIDVLQGVAVKDIMQTNYTTVHPEMLLTELMPRFTLTHHHGFPIVDDNGYLQGIITLTDVERSHRTKESEHQQVIEVGTVNRIIKVFPDEPVYVALRQLNVYDIGRLPVVSRSDEKTFLGMVQRIDILKAYNTNQKKQMRIKFKWAIV